MKNTGKLLVMLAVLAMMFAFAGPMIARAEGTPPPVPPGTLDPGVDRYLAIRAIADIPQTAQCGSAAGSGAFGYFGEGNNMAAGANGYQTGLNNSAVCGSRP